MNDTLQIENTLIAALGGTEQKNAMQAQFERHRLYDAANLPELRPYQADLVARSLSALGQHRSVCMQAPTGGGQVGHVQCHRTRLARQSLHPHTPERTGKTDRRTHAEGGPARRDDHVSYPLLEPCSEGKIDAGMGRSSHRRRVPPRRRYDVGTGHNAVSGTRAGRDGDAVETQQKEGLDHIFDHLECSAPMSELLTVGALAHAHVKLPHEDDRVKGAGNNGGDYSELATWNANGQRIMVEKAIDWLDFFTTLDRAIVYACGQRNMHDP